MNPLAPSFVDFFAGSALVTQEAKHACVLVWSKDGDHDRPMTVCER